MNKYSGYMSAQNTGLEIYRLCHSYEIYIFPLYIFHKFPLNYFSFQPVFHNWFSKGCDMYYPVCGVVHIKDSMLLICIK